MDFDYKGNLTRHINGEDVQTIRDYLAYAGVVADKSNCDEFYNGCGSTCKSNDYDIIDKKFDMLDERQRVEIYQSINRLAKELTSSNGIAPRSIIVDYGLKKIKTFPFDDLMAKEKSKANIDALNAFEEAYFGGGEVSEGQFVCLKEEFGEDSDYSFIFDEFEYVKLLEIFETPIAQNDNYFDCKLVGIDVNGNTEIILFDSHLLQAIEAKK